MQASCVGAIRSASARRVRDGQHQPLALPVGVAELDRHFPRPRALEQATDRPVASSPASEVLIPFTRDVVGRMELDVLPVRLADTPTTQALVVDLRTTLVGNDMPIRVQGGACTFDDHRGRSLRESRVIWRYGHGHDWRGLAANDSRAVGVGDELPRDIDPVNLAVRVFLFSTARHLCRSPVSAPPTTSTVAMHG